MSGNQAPKLPDFDSGIIRLPDFDSGGDRPRLKQIEPMAPRFIVATAIAVDRSSDRGAFAHETKAIGRHAGISSSCPAP
jgi:hypothetical protein